MERATDHVNPIIEERASAIAAKDMDVLGPDEGADERALLDTNNNNNNNRRRTAETAETANDVPGVR